MLYGLIDKKYMKEKFLIVRPKDEYVEQIRDVRLEGSREEKLTDTLSFFKL